MGSLDEQSSPAADQAIISNQQVFQPLNPVELRKQAHRVVDFIADYYTKIDSYPVLSQVEPGYLRNNVPARPPDDPEDLEAILGDVEEFIIPGMTHWASPNFFAYFPATISTAGFLGEMLCTTFNSVGFNWLASPAATELENVVMDWLANLLNLPTPFLFSTGGGSSLGDGGGGVIQGTTTEAILCAVVAARDEALARGSPDLDVGKLVVYGSDQTHTAYAKACRIAGILPGNIRSLKTTVDDNHLALSPARLQEAMAADAAAGLVPLFLCATVGTTSTAAVDPVGELAAVAKKYGAWVHVDAAYAGSACICPEFRHHLDGVERADSVSMSPHKWLLSHLDCCCLWVQNAASLTQALSTNPEYLRNKASELGGKVVEYKDWQVGVGRRFRALRLWMVLRSYGAAKLQAHIRSDVEMACMFEGLVREDGRFEVVVPRRFALVCFRLAAGDEMNRRLLEEVNATGRMYATHTVVDGAYVLRFAVGATLTMAVQVLAAWRLIQDRADVLVGEKATTPKYNLAMENDKSN